MYMVIQNKKKIPTIIFSKVITLKTIIYLFSRTTVICTYGYPLPPHDRSSSQPTHPPFYCKVCYYSPTESNSSSGNSLNECLIPHSGAQLPGPLYQCVRHTSYRYRERRKVNFYVLVILHIYSFRKRGRFSYALDRSYVTL